jgi:transcriptional regulator with XRE-family HTH domain
MSVRSPTLRRRRLGMELRRLRETAHLTIEQVAKELECSDSKISRIETGQVSATPRDVRDILDIYGVPEEERKDLIQIAREARQKAWWHAYTDLPLSTFVGLEAAASSMSIYAAQILPALFQTRDYAQAVIRVIHHSLNSEDIERRVELCMVRQSLLAGDDPPELWVVMDEAAIRRQVGGSEVMRKQIEQLIKVGSLPNVTLQVLPFVNGEHTGLDGAFMIVSFPEEADPNMVYIENTAAKDLYVEETDVVQEYEVLFDHLRASALAPADSVQFLANVAREL